MSFALTPYQPPPSTIADASIIPGWVQRDHASRFVVFLSSTCPHCLHFKSSQVKMDWVKKHDAIVYEFGGPKPPPPTMKVGDVKFVPMIVYFDQEGCAHKVQME